MNSESPFIKLISALKGKLEKLPFIGGFFSEGTMKQSSMNLFIAQAIYTFTIFFIDILLARTLSDADFGVWKHILLLVNLSSLILLGLPQGFNYFANLEIDKRRIHLNNVLATMVILCSVFFLAILIGFRHVLVYALNDEFIITASLIYPAVILVMGLYAIIEMLIVIDKRTALLPQANLIFGSFYFIAIVFIAAYYFIVGIESTSLAAIIIMTLLSAHLLRSGGLWHTVKIKFRRKDIDFSLIRRYLVYGFPIYMATFVGLLNGLIDQFIVSNFEGLDIFGKYAVGARGFPLIPAVGVIVAQSIFPQLMDYQNRGLNHKAQNLWLKSSVKASYLLYPIIIALLISVPYLIRFLYGAGFEIAIEVFQAYLIILLFRHNGYGRLLMIRDENKWLMIFMIISILANITVSIILYRRIGIMGVVWGTIVAQFVNVFLILSKERLLGRYLKAFFIDNFVLGIMILFILASIILNWF